MGLIWRRLGNSPNLPRLGQAERGGHSVKECAVETIRTAVVLVFLLAILYGAYTVLNQPMTPAPADVGWNDQPLEPPQLDFGRADEAPVVNIPDLPMPQQPLSGEQPPVQEFTGYPASEDPYAQQSGGGEDRVTPPPPFDPPPTAPGGDIPAPDDAPPLLPIDTDNPASVDLTVYPPPAMPTDLGVQSQSSPPAERFPDPIPQFRSDGATEPAATDTAMQFAGGESVAAQPPPDPATPAGAVEDSDPPTPPGYNEGRAQVRDALARGLAETNAAPYGTPPGMDAAPASSDALATGPPTTPPAPAAEPAADPTPPAGADPLGAFGVASRPLAPRASPVGYESRPNPSSDAAPEAAAAPQASFRSAMTQAADLVRGGQPREALALLTPWLREQLPDEQRQQLLNYLDPLAGRVVYSRADLLAGPYLVRGGESLRDIAERYQVPWQLLAKINGLNSPNSPPAETKLKIVPGPFRAVVDLSDSELTLYVQDLYAGRFPLRLGDDPAPREGEYQVRGRAEGHAYYAADGAKTPARGPANPYGRFWLDLGKGVALHETSPQAVSRGCLGLSSRDAEDIYAILDVGAVVRIKP